MVTPKKSQPGMGTKETKKPGKTPAADNNEVQGEGDYASAREFNKDEREFVESHDTEDLARRAAPEDASSAAELDKAERKGKARARPDPEADSAGDPSEADADDDTEAGRS